MGDTRKKRHVGPVRKKSPKKRTHTSFCSIPIPQLPHLQKTSSYSHSPIVGNDFYTAVNSSWIESVKIPEHENDFGVSEEVEQCILEETKKIFDTLHNSPEESQIATLVKSGLDSVSQHYNVEYLQDQLNSLKCIEEYDDVLKAFISLSKSRFKSLLNFQIFIDPEKTCHLALDCEMPGLREALYTDAQKMKRYKEFLRDLGERFRICSNFDKIYKMERDLVYLSYTYWTPKKTKTTGNGLLKKFPGFPWKLWFEGHGIEDWKRMTIYYSCPRWIRKISSLLKTVPIVWWKMYLARCFILNGLHYLPPPFDEIDFEFFGSVIQGQKKKLPQLDLTIHTVYNYCTDIFSELFWKRHQNEKLVDKVKELTQNVLEAGMKCLENVSWLSHPSRKKAIEKLKAMRLEVVRPDHWPPFTPVELNPRCLLQNVYLLGESATETLLKRIGSKYRFWEEGTFRVNAYYFNENNEIMIPYGTCVSPFFESSAPLGWNYGGLGCAIGHEICHGFDEDGKEFGPSGERKPWWNRSDKAGYTRKANQLIKFYGKQGKRTLSENFADLCGLKIALEALKMELSTASEETRLEAFRHFFTAYAVSWRTVYRKEKLDSLRLTDNHSPANLRVNNIVPHFQEWYDAFGVTPESKLYLEHKDRIKVF
jgi:putative endopeptidase